MVDYIRIRNRAQVSIKKYGKPAQLLVRTRVGGTDRSPEYSTVSHNIVVVELNQVQKNMDGSLAPASLHTLIVSTEGLTLEPRREHQVRIKGSTYSIKDVRPLEPGIVTLLWEIDLAG